MVKNSLISIIIVNFNGKHWLKKLLPDLETQTYSNFEIIVVDNGSADGSGDFLHSVTFPIRIITLHRNQGFAAANNIGFSHSKGEYILLLNNDMHVQPDFLSNFVKGFQEIPNLGSIQCELKLLDDDAYLDSVGSKFGRWGQFRYLGIHESPQKYQKPIAVLANIGAAMLIKRSVIEKIGLFDDAFFMYFEDADFCHRVWLSGWECWYYPKASAFHVKHGTSSNESNHRMRFHDFKNGIRSQLKNFELSTLLQRLPQYILYQLFQSCLLLFQRNIRIFYDLEAIGWNIINISSTVKLRKRIQHMRTVSDKDIYNQLK